MGTHRYGVVLPVGTQRGSATVGSSVGSPESETELPSDPAIALAGT